MGDYISLAPSLLTNEPKLASNVYKELVELHEAIAEVLSQKTF